MKIHRFYYKQTQPKNIEITNRDIAHQIFKVLRLKIGERVILFNGLELLDFIFEVKALAKNKITLDFLEFQQNNRESDKKIHLHLSILKNTNFELAVAKTVELGVTSITPIITERTIKTNLNLERIGKIIKEAAEQSGRGVVPQIFNPIKLVDVISQAKNPIIFDPAGEKNIVEDKKEISIFIGPEGGWTADELELARNKKVKIASLGKTILRAETATIVGTFFLLS